MPDKGYLENEPKYKCISCVYLTVQIERAITTLCIAITREEIKYFCSIFIGRGPQISLRNDRLTRGKQMEVY